MAEPSHKLRDDQSGQNATPFFIKQVAKYLTVGAAGIALLGVSALTLALTVVGLVVATPVLLVLSPVLVPAVMVVLIAASGFVLSGGFGMAALSLLAWIYYYLAGKCPIGSGKVDMLREKLARTTQALEGLHATCIPETDAGPACCSSTTTAGLTGCAAAAASASRCC